MTVSGKLRYSRDSKILIIYNVHQITIQLASICKFSRIPWRFLGDIPSHHHHSSSTFNVTRTQFEKDKALYTALRPVPRYQTTSTYMMVFFNSIGRMLFEAPTIDNADPLFALMITPVLYMHRIEVAYQDPAGWQSISIYVTKQRKA